MRTHTYSKRVPLHRHADVKMASPSTSVAFRRSDCASEGDVSSIGTQPTHAPQAWYGGLKKACKFCDGLSWRTTDSESDITFPHRQRRERAAPWGSNALTGGWGGAASGLTHPFLIFPGQNLALLRNYSTNSTHFLYQIHTF